MHWAFDLDTRKLTNPSDGLGIRNVRLAYPDRYPATIDVTRSGAPVAYDGAVVLTLRPVNGQTGTDLAKAILPAAVLVPPVGELSLATEELNEWLPDFGESPAVLEVLVVDDLGVEVSSLAVAATVSRRYGSLVGTPTPLPNGLAEALAAMGIEFSEG